MTKWSTGDLLKPGKAFRFKWQSVEPGDIICSTIPKNLVSQAIRLLTWSNFSHLSLCVEPQGCVEASENVARFSLLHIGCIDANNVKVLRLRNDACTDARAVRQLAGQNGETFVGQPYWTQGAYRALFRIQPPAWQPGAFCSHLVAKAYQEAGLNIIPSVRPEHVTPDHVAKSQLFEDISQIVLEPFEVALMPYMEYLDAERSIDTPHLKETALGLEVCGDIAKDFKTLCKKTPRSLSEAQMIVVGAHKEDPQLALKLDALLARRLNKYHFVDEMLRVMPRKPLYDPDHLAAWLMGKQRSDPAVAEVYKQCTDWDDRSDKRLQERMESCKAYEAAAQDGFCFASRLGSIAKEAYKVVNDLTIANRACIDMIMAFVCERDFVQFAPAGDPVKRLELAAQEICTFVLRSQPRHFPGRKYHGRLQDCLCEYVNHIGRTNTETAVDVYRFVNGNMEFLPPPPLEEGSWLWRPTQLVSRNVEVLDLGDVEF